VTAKKKRPTPHFYRVIEPGGSGLEAGQIIVERKGYGPILSRMYTNFKADGTPDQVTVFRAEKVPHSELPAEMVENATKHLESTR
jgi:hypothetical protein